MRGVGSSRCGLTELNRLAAPHVASWQQGPITAVDPTGSDRKGCRMWIFHRPPGRARHDAPHDTDTIHAGGVSVRTEHHTGLDRAAVIRNSDARGRRTWSRAIRDHVGRVPQAVDGPTPAEFLSAEQLLARLRPWVVTRDSIEPDTPAGTPTPVSSHPACARSSPWIWTTVC
ncbi:hypothetical protein GR925_36450 [Streptomyces sp. HUCO-GS316]|uniref:hypothetical protein n=1 Tax=Streptomyces sp. HUCO-GS316 TaxID=2692198 RepID=UPI00136C0648|nr:hypothetical protein [Streptomyces sp. HUCO-GS316]MXM68753.1 hypothetical protein [Streptomyces sp. HUCO-GS316]